MYIIRRLLLLIPVLFLISVAVFGLLFAMPGDPLDTLVLGDPLITKEDIEALKELYGVNDPMPVRYLKWLRQILQGNFGFSRTYKMPVTALVLPRMKNTIILATLSLVVSLGISLPLGIYSAIKQYSATDYVVTLFAFLGFALPNFWLGLMLIILLSVRLRWLPPGGIVSVDVGPGFWEQVIDRARFLAMPVFVLGISAMASWTRYMRSSMLEVVRKEFVLTARAKGLTESMVMYGHVLKNALIPVVTLVGNTIPIVFGGSVIVETVFSYPGMGKLLYDSILENDFSVSMAILLFLALLVIAFNLLADIAIGYLDPRIRYDE